MRSEEAEKIVASVPIVDVTVVMVLVAVAVVA